MNELSADPRVEAGAQAVADLGTWLRMPGMPVEDYHRQVAVSALAAADAVDPLRQANRDNRITALMLALSAAYQEVVDHVDALFAKMDTDTDISTTLGPMRAARGETQENTA